MKLNIPKKLNRKLKSKLLNKLNSMLVHYKFAIKHIKRGYQNDNYANVDDIEYILGDIDDYYTPILTSFVFNNGCKRYHFRGDKQRIMSVKSYIGTIIPYLTMLIDDNKVNQQNIQLDIGLIMIHIDDKCKITHFFNVLIT